MTVAEFRRNGYNSFSADDSADDGSTSFESVDTETPEEPSEGFAAEESPLETADEQEPVEEEQVEEAPEDLEWLESVKSYKELHGVQLTELLQALADGKIPEALWDKLSIPMKDGEHEWEDTIANARNGAMMRRNYTQKLQQFSQERDAFNAEKNELVGLLHGWKSDTSGKQLLAAMRKMGMPFEQAARAFAEELYRMEELQKAEAEGKVPQGTAAALQQKQQLEQELAELKMQREQFQGNQQKQQTEQQTKQIVEAVKNEAVKSFEKAGLKRTEGSWNVFLNHLNAVWTAKGAAPSRAEIHECVLAAKEDVEAAVQKHQAAQKAPAKKLPAAPMDSAAKRAVPKSAPSRQAVTTKQFLQQMRNGSKGPFG